MMLMLAVCVPRGWCEISSLDRFLPQDTVSYFVVKDLQGIREAAHETAFYEVWDSKGMQSVRAEMTEIWKKAVVSHTQVDPLNFIEAIKKDAVLGIGLHFDPALGFPKGLSHSIVLAVEDPEGEFKNVVATTKKLLEESNPAGQLTTFTHKEAEVVVMSASGEPEVSATTLPGVFLLCVGESGLAAKTVDQGTQKEQAGFISTETYPALVGLFQERDLSLAWLDANKIIATLQDIMRSSNPNSDPATLLGKIGIDNASSYYLRAYIDHRGFFREQIVGFDGPVHGLLKFFFHPGELTRVDRFSPESDFVMNLSLGSVSELWANWKDLLFTLGGQKALDGMTSGVQAFEMMLGFSFEQDLFPSIGNELALGLEGERMTVFLQAADEKKLAELIPKLLLLWEVTPEPMQVEGTTYSRAQVPESDLALFYGVGGGFLTVSNSPEGYLTAVKEPDKKTSILESRRYGKALANMPPANSAITITDLRGMAAYTSTIMNLQQAFGGGNATAALDLSFLGDETFPIVDVAVAQEDRLIRWSYSESGIEGILTAFSFLKAFSQQSMPGQGKNKLSRCEAELRILKTVLESYFLDNTRYPDNLNQLTEPIKYMSSVPSDPWTGKPYYYERREDSYILIGAGPDGKIDLDTKTIEGKFTAEKIPDSVRYHPAKGPDAGGDVIRVGP